MNLQIQDKLEELRAKEIVCNQILERVSIEIKYDQDRNSLWDQEKIKGDHGFLLVSGKCLVKEIMEIEME